MVNISSYLENANENRDLLPLEHFEFITVKILTRVNCWWGFGKNGFLIYCLWGCKMVQSLWKTSWQCITKLNIYLSQTLAIPALDFYPEKWKLWVVQKPIRTVHSSSIHNSPKLETTICLQIGEQTVPYPCSGVLLSSEKEQAINMQPLGCSSRVVCWVKGAGLKRQSWKPKLEA